METLVTEAKYAHDQGALVNFIYTSATYYTSTILSSEDVVYRHIFCDVKGVSILRSLLFVVCFTDR